MLLACCLTLPGQQNFRLAHLPTPPIMMPVRPDLRPGDCCSTLPAQTFHQGHRTKNSTMMPAKADLHPGRHYPTLTGRRAHHQGRPTKQPTMLPAATVDLRRCPTPAGWTFHHLSHPAKNPGMMPVMTASHLRVMPASFDSRLGQDCSALVGQKVHLQRHPANQPLTTALAAAWQKG